MAGETTTGSSGGGGSSRACKGICQVLSGVTTTTVMGILTLEQSNVHQPVHITGKLTGLTPGKHGMSICVAGDLSHGPTSCGPIFNPFDKTHGAPEDSIDQRMMGDLGNILVDEMGKSNVDLTITKLSLLGPHSILGRSIVIYAGEDDQGRGGHENSLINGNPGPRIAAGVIGLAM